MMGRRIRIAAVIAGVAVLMAGCEPNEKSSGPTPPSTSQDTLAVLAEILADPAECGVCHPTHYREWQESMHAYAIDDPVFQALHRVGQERSGGQLDQFCLKCHTPAGSLLGETPPDFEVAQLSPLAAAGVSCDVCHSMDTRALNRGLGVTEFRLDRVRRGPISDPVANPYHESEMDLAYAFSDICAPCHDLAAPDGSFLLETTNTEWDNSAFAAMGVECQSCHMPTYSGRAAEGGPVRDNLHRHTFIGVDYPLIPYPGRQATIDAVAELLRNSVTVTVVSPGSVRPGEALDIEVQIKNDRSGHNIPSGAIFERQMWIELVVRDTATDSVVFATGLLDGNGDLRNQKSLDVRDGRLPADTALVLYNGIPRDADGNELLFFWEAAFIENRTIPAFRTDISRFTVPAPGTATALEASLRLRFRTFPPYLFRELDLEHLLPELLVMDMHDETWTVAVRH